MSAKKQEYVLTPVYDEKSFSAVQDLQDVPAAVIQAAAMAKAGGLPGSYDAADTLVFARELETIKNKIYEVKYAELKGRQFVPTSYEGGPNSDFITYRVWDGVTMAMLISNYATDYPLVTAAAREVTMKYWDFGNAYGYSIQDLQKAASAGKALDSQYAMLARRGHEILIDDAFAVGVKSIGSFGLTNHPNVTLQTLPFGDWTNVARTGLQILTDMNSVLTAQWLVSQELFMADTFLMSSAAYRLVATKLLNDANGSNITVLAAFKAQNPGVSVGSWTKLNTANAAGTNGRMVAYKRDEEVLQFEMGEDFKVWPAQQEGLMLKHICTSRFAGLAIRHPLAISYVDAQLV